MDIAIDVRYFTTESKEKVRYEIVHYIHIVQFIMVHALAYNHLYSANRGK